jgi:hypothetical protein
MTMTILTEVEQLARLVAVKTGKTPTTSSRKPSKRMRERLGLHRNQSGVRSTTPV